MNVPQFIWLFTCCRTWGCLQFRVIMKKLLGTPCTGFWVNVFIFLCSDRSLCLNFFFLEMYAFILYSMLLAFLGFQRSFNSTTVSSSLFPSLVEPIITIRVWVASFWSSCVVSMTIYFHSMVTSWVRCWQEICYRILVFILENVLVGHFLTTIKASLKIFIPI